MVRIVGAPRIAGILVLAGCSFEGYSNPARVDAGSGSGSVDAAPVTCGSLTCDPVAICHDSGGAASCSCPTGYRDDNGDGTACSDIDECATPTTCTAMGQAACENTPGSYTCYTPTSCADAQAHHAPTGGTTLYVNGSPTRPWAAWCDGDKTYLPLPQGSGKNFAQFTHPNGIGGTLQTDLRTTYQMIRIDPATLVVDIRDTTHAQSTGTLFYGITQVRSIAYGCAMDCNGDNRASGVANIDLTGTPFHVSEAQTWTIAGDRKLVGAATPGNGGQVVDITGGGGCGWAIPSPGLGNGTPPINNFSGNSSLLKLVYP